MQRWPSFLSTESTLGAPGSPWRPNSPGNLFKSARNWKISSLEWNGVVFSSDIFHWEIAEILLESAKFSVSRVFFNKKLLSPLNADINLTIHIKNGSRAQIS